MKLFLKKTANFYRKFCHKTEAVVAIEFAFIAPLLVLIFSGIIAFGGNIIERHTQERGLIEVTAMAAFISENSSPLPSGYEAGLRRTFEDSVWGLNDADYEIIIQRFDRDPTGVDASRVWKVTFGSLANSGSQIIDGSDNLSDTNLRDLLKEAGDALVTVELYRENYNFDISQFLDGNQSTTYMRLFELTRSNDM